MIGCEGGGGYFEEEESVQRGRDKEMKMDIGTSIYLESFDRFVSSLGFIFSSSVWDGSHIAFAFVHFAIAPASSHVFSSMPGTVPKLSGSIHT